MIVCYKLVFLFTANRFFNHFYNQYMIVVNAKYGIDDSHNGYCYVRMKGQAIHLSDAGRIRNSVCEVGLSTVSI